MASWWVLCMIIGAAMGAGFSLYGPPTTPPPKDNLETMFQRANSAYREAREEAERKQWRESEAFRLKHTAPAHAALEATFARDADQIAKTLRDEGTVLTKTVDVAGTPEQQASVCALLTNDFYSVVLSKAISDTASWQVEYIDLAAAACAAGKPTATYSYRLYTEPDFDD